jgi:triosephosphate isomerase
VDAGIPFVILGKNFSMPSFHITKQIKGHSERRTIFLETSELVAKKTKAAISAGLSVILCIGETLEEREAGRTKEVCETQLKAVVDVLKEADWRYVLLKSVYIVSQFPTVCAARSW